MTLLLNVTDAISSASNHGITRTERQLARALADRTDVDFVAMANGRLWGIDREVVTSRLDPVATALVPSVERLGVDPPPLTAPTGTGALVCKAVRALRDPQPVGSIPPGLSRLRVADGDTLVSVGLDWVHDLLGDAERLHFGRGVEYVGFCYDLIPIDHPEWIFPPDPDLFVQHFRRANRIASQVLCISESTRRDFVRRFPEYDAARVRVLPLGADAAVEVGEEQERFAAGLCDGEPYAVYCATLDRRKNHRVLYRAAREMARQGIPGNIVLVGKVGTGVDDLMYSLRHDPQIAGRFVHVTNCDDAHLAAIYRRARFAVYPSLYEGWGLGVTEALAHGKPCLIAEGSSLSEAGLGVCRELHPLRTLEWVDAMTEYFADPPEIGPVAIPTWADAAAALVGMVGR